MITHTNNTVHLQEYFKVLRTRFWVIFTILVLTVLSGAYVTEEVLPKIYSADSQLEIRPRGTLAVATLDSNNTDGHFDPTLFQAEFEIMQSPRVLDPVIDEMGLDKKWAKSVFKVPSITHQRALDYLNSLLHIDFKRGTDIVVVTASDEDPKEAADIANAVADTYSKMRDNEEASRSDRGADEIQEQIKTQEDVVADKLAVVNRLRDEARKNNVFLNPSSESETTQDDTDLQHRTADLLTAREDADARRVLVESTLKLTDEEFVNTMEAMNRQQRNIQDLRAQNYKLQSDRNDLLQRGYAANHRKFWPSTPSWRRPRNRSKV